VPTVHKDHWSCYALVWGKRQLYVLDSLGHKRKQHGRKAIDVAVVMSYLFGEIYCSSIMYGENCVLFFFSGIPAKISIRFLFRCRGPQTISY